MVVNDKEKQWERGTDQAYNAPKESQEAEQLERETLEDSILLDSDEFERLALLYAKASQDKPLLQGFLAWSVEQLRKEKAGQEPAHQNAWRRK